MFLIWSGDIPERGRLPLRSAAFVMSAAPAMTTGPGSLLFGNGTPEISPTMRVNSPMVRACLSIRYFSPRLPSFFSARTMAPATSPTCTKVNAESSNILAGTRRSIRSFTYWPVALGSPAPRTAPG
jgi:hypothetical protein